MHYRFTGLTVLNFRSITSLSLQFEPGELITLCGQNSVGKSNLLVAFALLFAMDPCRFNHETDTPYHVLSHNKNELLPTSIEGQFLQETTNQRVAITAEFRHEADTGNVLTLHGVTADGPLTDNDCRSILSKFRFHLIEAGADVKQLMRKLWTGNGSSDVNRSSEAYQQGTNLDLRSLARNLPEHVSPDWQASINVPSPDSIDQNSSVSIVNGYGQAVDRQGTGIQRLAVLAMMKHLTSVTDETCVWALDEPELHLHPTTQRVLLKELQRLAQSTPIIMTTHSLRMIDLANLNQTFLLKAHQEVDVDAQYSQKPYLNHSTVVDRHRDADKLEVLRNEFAVSNNDAWVVFPRNLLVEGEADKKYLLAVARMWGITLPNILVAGGANNAPAHLEFLAGFCHDLNFKPQVTCLFDWDQKGRQATDRITSKITKNTLPFTISVQHVCRADGRTGPRLDYEIEDWVYPDFVFEGVSTILEKQGYAPLTAAETRLRNYLGYSDSPMLDFVSEVVKMRNPEKPQLHFSSTLSLKGWLCREVCNIVEASSSSTANDLDSRFPAARSLLRSLSADNPLT